MLRVRGVTDRLMTSRDLRHFDVSLWPTATRQVASPVGVLTAAPTADGQTLQIRFADSFDPRRWRILYYSAGSVHELTMPQAPANPVVTLQNWK